MNISLETLGYLRSESLVYQALLKKGPSLSGSIAKETKLNRVSVYKALQKLIDDGLVSYTIKSNRKTFKPINPREIKRIIDSKRKELYDFEKKIPDLIAQFHSKEEDVKSEIYEGVKGLKALEEKYLAQGKKGETWYVMGAPKKAELLGGYYKELNNRRSREKIKLKIIFNKDAISLYEVRKKQPLTQVRIMPDNYITPASIEIHGNQCAIVLYSPKIIVFNIENKEVADSFKQYFHLIWRNSEKV